MTEQGSESQTSRRKFLQAGSTAAAATLTSALAAAQGSGRKPNIVMFLGEGQRADALGLAGHPLLKTPNHDRIGREGVYFNNAFVTNALCAPARAVTMTGLYSHTTGALGNKNVPLTSATPVFTDLLRDAGYEIALCGKAHIGNGLADRYWDYYFGFNSPATNYYHPRFIEGRKGQFQPVKEFEGYCDDVMTDHAMAWLKEPREKPFCLLVWFQAPHAPFYRARRHLDLYNGVPIPKPVTFDDDMKGYPGKPRCVAGADNKIGTTILGNDDPRTVEELVKDYWAGLIDVDENMGRVLDHLKQTNQLDDTVVMQTSDHGFFLGEWRMYDKRLMYEPSIKVPMMIRYPKVFKAGSKVDQMVLNLDIAPTLLELAGVPVPTHMQGRSMVKLATSGDPAWRKDWLYEYYEYPGSQNIRPHRGVRTERYKYIHYTLAPEEFELYDLHNDPGERNNLYGKPGHESLTHTLQNRMTALRRETGEAV